MNRRAFPLAVIFVLCVSALAKAADNSPPPDLALVRSTMVGTWQSVDDPKFTREFSPDGSAAERYEGDASATTPGRWSLFLGSAPPRGLAGRTLQPRAIYLELDQNGDKLLFGLAGLTRSDLKMVYLERGNLVSFTRLK
jgi:hypothetical protein